MTLILGHTNTDLDCLGSMVLARYLYPDPVLVRSEHIHPVARNLYNLYHNHLKMRPLADLVPPLPERIVIVDTRTRGRVKEYFQALGEISCPIEIWDHHPADDHSIPGTIVHEGPYGANTTLLALELRRRKITIDPSDATIALAGLYADTGNFVHENVSTEDFQTAAWLLEQGAAVTLVRRFLKRLSQNYQITIFHQLLNRLVYHEARGHFLITGFMELEEQQGGLAAVVEEVHEVENPDATFLVFHLKKEQSTLIIARSQKQSLAVNRILARFAGGGHTLAASAYLKRSDSRAVYRELVLLLRTGMVPAITAADIMTTAVETIKTDWTLKQASIFLEQSGHTGAPVVDAAGKLAGILTLRDIMKGRQTGRMETPVAGFMARQPRTVTPETPIREVEDIIFRQNLGHIPVLEGEHLAGIITRTNLILFLQEQEKREQSLLENEQARESIPLPPGAGEKQLREKPLLVETGKPCYTLLDNKIKEGKEMLANFNHQEKKALLAIVKFIIDADGVISEEEAERCGKLAEEKGFEDFSTVFAEVDRDVKSIDDVLVLAAKVKDTGHEQDILGIAIDIAEADANLLDAEDSFISRLAELWGIPLNTL